MGKWRRNKNVIFWIRRIEKYLKIQKLFSWKNQCNLNPSSKSDQEKKYRPAFRMKCNGRTKTAEKFQKPWVVTNKIVTNSNMNVF